MSNSVPTLMGVLNVTPDSFSDGGDHWDPDNAASRARDLIQGGAAIIDVGGESTRPGAPPVSADEETHRVVPVIAAIRQTHPTIEISVDTTKPDVAEAAVRAGANMINDVSGLQVSENLADIAARSGARLVISHMRGTPRTMQEPENLIYDDLLGEIRSFLQEAMDKAVAKGVPRENLLVDPGIGFSKTAEQNLVILNRIDFLRPLNTPILVGPSRKSFIGKFLDEPEPKNRLWGTAGVVAWLTTKNIDVIRVHDVKEMAQVVRMTALCAAGGL